MTASRKKPVKPLHLDEVYLAGAQERAGFWTDDAAKARPLSSRSGIEEFSAVSARPANDSARPLRAARAEPRPFVISHFFWRAMAATLVLCVLAAALIELSRGPGLAAMLTDPMQSLPVWAAFAVLVALPWMFALSAHRQAASHDMLRRVVLATQRLHEPSALAADLGRRVNASFDQLFADIDSHMALLDHKSAQLAEQISATMHHSAEEADANIGTMRSIVEASETQREALQRTGMMISTDILPVIAKLETTVASLETVSQSGGSLLETIGSRLQQTTQELKFCLDAFNNANHHIAPAIDKRLQKFEASIAMLPEQLDATIGRLGPMSETIADAAMLSTANVEVIDQLGKDIASALDQSRVLFTDLSGIMASRFEDMVNAQVGRFREMLESAVTDEAARVTALSRELHQLTETATAVVDKLQQPIADVGAAADRALANASQSIATLDQQIEAKLKGCVTDLNDVAARLVGSVSREMEASTVGLQTRLAASSTDLMQRVGADTARFEALIGETAERTSNRITLAVKDLPALLAQRLETEIAKVDGSLKGSVFGLSDQLRAVIDAIPNRLTALTRETLLTLESSVERSFDGVAQRSEALSEQFRSQATETAETLLQSYVDFIYVAVDRFRKEMEAVNHGFREELGDRLAVLSHGVSVDLNAPALPPLAAGTSDISPGT
jgi:hypothetical protein